MKIRFLCAAMLGMLSIQSAQADFTEVYSDANNALDPGEVFSITTPVLPVGEPFTNLYQFDLGTSSVGTEVVVASLTTDNFGFADGFSADLVNGVAGGMGSVIGAVNTEGLSTVFPLTAGNTYTLRVTGVPSGEFGGLYAGVIAAVVPEPHQWALLFAGLGLITWTQRRRLKM